MCCCFSLGGGGGDDGGGAARRDGGVEGRGVGGGAWCCVWIVNFDMELKAHPAFMGPAWHPRLHFYEVANWLMWPILIALLGALTFRQDRRLRSQRQS